MQSACVVVYGGICLEDGTVRCSLSIASCQSTLAQYAGLVHPVRPTNADNAPSEYTSHAGCEDDQAGAVGLLLLVIGGYPMTQRWSSATSTCTPKSRGPLVSADVEWLELELKVTWAGVTKF